MTGKQEFLRKLRRASACRSGIELAESCGTLQEMADQAVAGDLFWCLRRWPELADEVEINWDKLDGYHWACLLIHHPELEDRCDWSKLDGSNWAGLLIYRPELKDRCDWSKLDDADWTYLIWHCPEFEGYRKRRTT